MELSIPKYLNKITDSFTFSPNSFGFGLKCGSLTLPLG